MFEKVGEVAEQMATSVSRRGFLGRVAQAALGTVGLLGVLVSSPGDAHAGKGCGNCCWYGSIYNQPQCVPKDQSCPASYNGFPLVKEEKRCTFCCCC
jgi:hypothetical protein